MVSAPCCGPPRRLGTAMISLFAEALLGTSIARLESPAATRQRANSIARRWEGKKEACETTRERIAQRLESQIDPPPCCRLPRGLGTAMISLFAEALLVGGHVNCAP